jgi:hypothetical protein
MSCPKCSGLMATLYDDTRCFNCGYREGDFNRKIGDEVGRPIFLSRKCHHCKNSASPGRSLCAYHAQANAARKREERRARKVTA